MGKWKKCTINDLGTVVGGATPSTKIPENYDGGSISWITPKDLAGFTGRYISHGERNITEQGLKSCSTQLMPAHTILFSSRAPIGYVAIAKNEVCTNQGFKSVIPNKTTDYMFLYYLLKFNKNKIESLGSGTTFKEVSGSMMRGIEVYVPESIEEQRRIALILASLDDKIENNEKLNQNLLQQAGTVFDHWFGRYFGESVIPDGWKISELSDLDVLITDYVANGSFKSLADNVEYLDSETNNVLIRLTDYNNGFNSDMVYISDSAYDFLSKSKLFGDEIVISNVGANVGTVFRCPRLNKRMSLAPNAIMIRSELYEHYLFLLFTSRYGQHLLQSIVTGSAQPKFNKTNFRSLKILIPDKKALTSFNAIYSPINEMMVQNNKENRLLSSLRDSLLPKLMSGELDVSEIDI